MLTIYLAGPEVFLPDAHEAGRRKQALCSRYGFVGLYPLDGPDPAAADPALPADTAIYRANLAMIRAADCAVFNLTPFRGPGADPGTVFELGMCVGLGKPVFGYTNAAEDLLVRIRRAGPLSFDPARGEWRDADGLLAEDFGNADNLMIDAALRESGVPIRRVAAAEGGRFRDLSGFEACLAAAAARFSIRHPQNAP